MSSLKGYVTNWIIENGLQAARDVQRGGCINGCCYGLTEYSETIRFYEKYHDEILQCIKEFGVTDLSRFFDGLWDESDPLALHANNQNLLAWFGFEIMLNKIMMHFDTDNATMILLVLLDHARSIEAFAVVGQRGIFMEIRDDQGNYIHLDDLHHDSFGFGDFFGATEDDPLYFSDVDVDEVFTLVWDIILEGRGVWLEKPILSDNPVSDYTEEVGNGKVISYSD